MTIPAPCLGALQIIRGPRNISNATLGGSAMFECIIDNEHIIPRWNIAGRDYDVSSLPIRHSYQQNSFSKVLTVSPLVQEMNNSCFYCYILFNGGRMESTAAKLIIQSIPIQASSFQFQLQSTTSLSSSSSSSSLSALPSSLAHVLPRSTPGTMLLSATFHVPLSVIPITDSNVDYSSHDDLIRKHLL